MKYLSHILNSIQLFKANVILSVIAFTHKFDPFFQFIDKNLTLLTSRHEIFILVTVISILLIMLMVYTFLSHLKRKCTQYSFQIKTASIVVFKTTFSTLLLTQFLALILKKGL